MAEGMEWPLLGLWWSGPSPTVHFHQQSPSETGIMNAELFIGDADGTEAIIDKADDGTPLENCRGWVCDACGTLYATKEAADVCCVEPGAVVGTSTPTV